MTTFNYTLVRTRTLSPLEILTAESYGIELEEEIEYELEVEYSVFGEYRPATWGYYGGEPEEFPEVELAAVFVLDDDGNTTPFELTLQEESDVSEAAYQDMEARRDDWY